MFPPRTIEPEHESKITIGECPSLQSTRNRVTFHLIKPIGHVSR